MTLAQTALSATTPTCLLGCTLAEGATYRLHDVVGPSLNEMEPNSLIVILFSQAIVTSPHLPLEAARRLVSVRLCSHGTLRRLHGALR